MQGRILGRNLSPYFFSSHLFDASQLCLLAVAGDDQKRILGTITARRMANKQLHVTTLAIEPDARQKGIASALLSALPNTKGVVLECAENNIKARRLYERFGFVRTGRKQNYYRDLGGQRDLTGLCGADGVSYFLPPASLRNSWQL